MAINHVEFQGRLSKDLEVQETQSGIKHTTFTLCWNEKYKDVEIIIQMRYLNEYLTNRAGSAPNRKGEKYKVIKKTCLMPFTDMWIEPNGNMGLCCCDNFEKTCLGDLTKTPLKEIWEGAPYQHLRTAIAGGRDKYEFCKYCDFIDAGLRMDAVKDELNHSETLHGARQSLKQL